MSEERDRLGLRLNRLLAAAGLKALDPTLTGRFADYLSLLVRWNSHVNLTAIRDEEGILSLHFVESIACARALPAGIETILDFGSGAGFPGIPIALCLPNVAVTLSESQGKKAAFLQEVIRVLHVSATVFPMRAEWLEREFDCVTLRAVDRMPKAVELAAELVCPGGWLALMTTGAEVERLQALTGAGFSWGENARLPNGGDRLLALGRRNS